MNLPNIDKIQLLDDAFAEYLKDHDTHTFTKSVSAVLNAFSGTGNQPKSFEISIIDSGVRNREPFFGMRVFPDKEFAEDIVRMCIQQTDKPLSFKEIWNRWRVIPGWVIEIDSKVFDRDLINFNPSELTAMLLHEIGHTVYSDRVIEAYYRAYQECRLQLNSAERASSKILYSIYLIPLTLACGIRNWGVTSVDLREEVFADQSVQKLGYAEHLISAYSKIIKATGSGGYESKNQTDAQLINSMTFCNVNVKDLRHRREKLKDELYSTGVTHNSQYIRDIVSHIMGTLGIAKKNRYTGNVVLESVLRTDFSDESFLDKTHLIFDVKEFNALEQSMKIARDHQQRLIAEEAFGFKKNKKGMEVPSQLDVDLLYVEVDRITNHADRRYVLDLIYHQEEKILHFLELCEYDDTLKKAHYGRMQSMLQQIAELRKAVLAKRNFDKQYKVFVKYPAGYEG